MTRAHSVLAVAIVLLVCGGVATLALTGTDDEGVVAPPAPSSEASTASTQTTTTTVATATTERIPWPALPDDGTARAIVTPTGVVAAVLGPADGGGYVVRSPCGNEVVADGTPVTGAHVVLDPGHGGDEPGAIGPAGTTEKSVNLAVALEAERRLEARGAEVVLTRYGDHRITLASRGAIAQAVAPPLFISVHHNADPDELRDTPGSETYFQIDSPASKRAAGLLYEEVVGLFAGHDISWAADRDAGAKYRPNSRGGDYYGILVRTAGIPAVLSEAAFISNPAEEALLRDPAFQATEAEAIARAAQRFLTTDEPGSGYIEPYPRTEPAGPGGGPGGCVDPPMG